MKRFWIVAFLLGLCVCCLHGQEREVRIGVMGLFHPTEIVVSKGSGKPLSCMAGEEHWPVSEPLHVALDGVMIRLANDGKTLAAELRCDDGQGGPADFMVAVPDKFSRHYHGKLEIQAQARELLVIVAMEVEVAVASIVAAESLPHAPLEALKAQAVASRSFLLAGRGRHRDFDFCDTTHCQFLRQPAQAGSPAARAAAETHGLVLAFKGESFAAMYSASCGGRTHSLEELGIPVRNYPYFAVTCDYCRRHPEKWVARISKADADNLSQTEASRLKLARRLGWKTVPSNTYSSHTEGEEVVLEGTGVGHGIGLCERGSVDMARRGSSFRQILEHYYPNTEIRSY
ncbi:MAG TPA: SpoIID/LytB domain-containing protein [Candidatus Sulfotelmatobacter sp.]|nr:SpoIID/LytB domain-containing protein [Candidatus Sulfotelmatobacter sp.]